MAESIDTPFECTALPIPVFPVETNLKATPCIYLHTVKLSHTAVELTELLDFLIQNFIFLSSALILFQSSLLWSILGAHFSRFQEIRAVRMEAHNSSTARLCMTTYSSPETTHFCMPRPSARAHTHRFCCLECLKRNRIKNQDKLATKNSTVMTM